MQLKAFGAQLSAAFQKLNAAAKAGWEPGKGGALLKSQRCLRWTVPSQRGQGQRFPVRTETVMAAAQTPATLRPSPLCDGFQGKHPVPVSILRSKNRLSRETATQASGERQRFWCLTSLPPPPHWTPLPETFLTPLNSSTAPICEIRNGHRRVKQLNVDTQQESLPLSTHAKDRGDTARRSLRELHIPVGNRKPGSRALFCLWGSPFPHLSWKPGPAAVFEWVEG